MSSHGHAKNYFFLVLFSSTFLLILGKKKRAGVSAPKSPPARKPKNLASNTKKMGSLMYYLLNVQL